MKKEEFLKNHQKYHLGVLPTEQQHPLTKGLKELAQKDLSQAVDTLKEVDRLALQKLTQATAEIEKLREKAQAVLQAGGRIFLCGCGATGRLSLLLEYLWREKFNTDQVVAFMAGGDVALVHSLEGFEDYPDLGARHLGEMGFSENDLLISCTEGGETPYVIGATEEAAKVSKHKPHFLYCNPDDVLCDKVERSKRVIENPQIDKICLFVGPMALSGSTRMQASTVLQLAVGFALLEDQQSVGEMLNEFINLFESTDFSPLAQFIAREEAIYKKGEYLMYEPEDFSISVFTDTTERSPTFSLPSFENDNYQGAEPSLCYISIPGTKTAEEAWNRLLLREPHSLEWGEIDEQTTHSYLQSFDFSEESLAARSRRLGGRIQEKFSIKQTDSGIQFTLQDLQAHFAANTTHSLLKHTLLKLLLNTHSTLMMGLMGRYQSNIMTWVTATNAKLVDRSARYVQALLEERGHKSDYLDVVHRIYDCQPELRSGECIVIKVLDSF